MDPILNVFAVLVIVIEGTVLSIVTEELFVVAVTIVPRLPARSEKVTEIAATPETEVAITGYVAVQLAPEPVTVAATPAIVTVGVAILSLAVMDSVIVLPDLAKFVGVLLLVIVTAVKVGAVLSTVNVVVPAGAAFPAASLTVATTG